MCFATLGCIILSAQLACGLLQAITGGTPTWFGIPVPFNLSTLIAIVRPQPVPAKLPLHTACSMAMGANPGACSQPLMMPVCSRSLFP